MKTRINKEVRIPQMRLVRKLYEEDGKNFIRIDNEWWELCEYKSYMKEKYAINVSFEIVG